MQRIRWWQRRELASRRSKDATGFDFRHSCGLCAKNIFITKQCLSVGWVLPNVFWDVTIWAAEGISRSVGHLVSIHDSSAELTIVVAIQCSHYDVYDGRVVRRKPNYLRNPIAMFGSITLAPPSRIIWNATATRWQVTIVSYIQRESVAVEASKRPIIRCCMICSRVLVKCMSTQIFIAAH